MYTAILDNMIMATFDTVCIPGCLGEYIYEEVVNSHRYKDISFRRLYHYKSDTLFLQRGGQCPSIPSIRAVYTPIFSIVP
jgi:hypothetical protein